MHGYRDPLAANRYSANRERLIREIAYDLWEQEGRPEGHSERLWLAAEARFETEIAERRDERSEPPVEPAVETPPRPTKRKADAAADELESAPSRSGSKDADTSVVAAATLVRRLIPDRSFTAEDPYVAVAGRVNIARPFFIALGGSNAERGASFLRQMVQGAPQAKFKPRGCATRPMRQEPAAPASPSRGPGNGILRAETGGRIQAQNAGEQSEFGSQTTLRLTNPPELGTRRKLELDVGRNDPIDRSSHY